MDKAAFSNPNGKLTTSDQGDLVFVPKLLPPNFEYDRALTYAISDAHTKLGRLAGIGELLPNPHILIAPYLRREAVLSSRIEGTEASLNDLFLYEIVGEESEELVYKRVREVRNYAQALEKSLYRVRPLKQKIDLKLIRYTHRILLRRVRGAERNPGNFRRFQNWIGAPGSKIEDALYVPPSPEHLPDLLSNIESFIRKPPQDMPVLVQCAVLHYQFEAVHPFVDGNGRIGRLLIPLFLCERDILPEGLLYLSAYLERHRTEYFAKLLAVSQRSEWHEWISFFLQAVSGQCAETIENIRRLLDLKDRYEKLLRKEHATNNAHLLKDHLFSNPYTTAKNTAEYLDVSFVTAQSTINSLVSHGILQETTKRKRDKIFVAREIINLLA